MIKYGPWELRDGSDFLCFENICCDPKAAVAGNIENTTCRLRARVGEFSGAATWDFDWQEMLCFVSDMKAFYAWQKKEASLDDHGLGASLNVQVSKTGTVTVTGDLYDETRLYQVLKFELFTDLSAVKLFLDQIERQLPAAPDTKTTR